jgi:hypothetical protein
MGVWAGALISVKDQSCLTPLFNHFLSLFKHLLGGLLGFVQNFWLIKNPGGVAGLV